MELVQDLFVVPKEFPLSIGHPDLSLMGEQSRVVKREGRQFVVGISFPKLGIEFRVDGGLLEVFKVLVQHEQYRPYRRGLFVPGNVEFEEFFSAVLPGALGFRHADGGEVVGFVSAFTGDSGSQQLANGGVDSRIVVGFQDRWIGAVGKGKRCRCLRLLGIDPSTGVGVSVGFDAVSASKLEYGKYRSLLSVASIKNINR